MKTLPYFELLSALKRLREETEIADSVNINVLSNITVHQVRETLEYELLLEGVQANITLGNYDNIMQDAMEIEEEVLAYEKYDLELYGHTGEWTEEMAHIWADRRGVADRERELAHRLSHDAGHNFTDRSGVWQKIA